MEAPPWEGRNWSITLGLGTVRPSDMTPNCGRIQRENDELKVRVRSLEQTCKAASRLLSYADRKE